MIRDGLLYLVNRKSKIEDENVLKNLTTFYLNLKGDKQRKIIIYETLTIQEQKIFWNIMLEGMTDVVLYNEYLNTIYLTKQDKNQIVEECINFLSNITKISNITIKRKLYTNIKKERKNKYM